MHQQRWSRKREKTSERKRFISPASSLIKHTMVISTKQKQIILYRYQISWKAILIRIIGLCFRYHKTQLCGISRIRMVKPFEQEYYTTVHQEIQTLDLEQRWRREVRKGKWKEDLLCIVRDASHRYQISIGLQDFMLKSSIVNLVRISS